LGSFLLVIVTSISVVALVIGLLAPLRLDELGLLASRRRAFLLAPFVAQAYQPPGSWAEVARQVDEFAQPLPAQLLADISLNLPIQAEVLAALNQDRLVVVDMAGRVIADSRHSLAAGQPLPPELQRYAVPIVVQEQPVGSLVLISGLEQAISGLVLTALQRTLWGAGLLAAVLAALVSLGLARRLVTPLQRLNQAARRLTSGDSHQPLPIATADEIGDLTATFNNMAQALETQKRLRRHLVADIAHELRTPLSIMQLDLEGLADGLQDPAEAAASLAEEVKRLSRLVEDLRLLSLAEAGGLHFELAQLEPAPFLQQVLGTWTPPAQARQVQLRAEWPSVLPPVSADAGRLRQVFDNLLSNALGYTPAGGTITLGARVEKKTWEVSKTSQVSTVVFWIADSGPGIALEDLPYVFERFYRADSSRSRDGGGGSGLGLAIAKQWVALHGGRVWVESQVDQGATFYMALPVAGAGN
jgi:two-component system OmpR family sensor kinase/two-component system sensor histidine kinase BaeS